jgi:hypothetical protein
VTECNRDVTRVTSNTLFSGHWVLNPGAVGELSYGVISNTEPKVVALSPAVVP